MLKSIISIFMGACLGFVLHSIVVSNADQSGVRLDVIEGGQTVHYTSDEIALSSVANSVCPTSVAEDIQEKVRLLNIKLLSLEEGDKGSMELLKLQLAILDLPVDSLFSILLNASTYDRGSAQVELLANTAFYAGMQYPQQSISMLENYSSDQKLIFGAALLKGAAKTDPVLVWGWADKQLPFDEELQFIPRYTFMELASLALGEMSKLEGKRWQAYELSKTVEETTQFNGYRWVSQMVAMAIAKEDLPAAIQYVDAMETPDQNFLQGVVNTLAFEGLSVASEFIVNRQQSIDMPILKNMTWSLLSEHSAEDANRFVRRINDEKRQKKIYEDSTYNLASLEADKIIAFLSGVESKEIKESMAGSLSVYMRSHQHKISDYIKVFDAVHATVEERNSDYSFALMMADWYKTRPDLAEPFIRGIQSSGSASANTFSKNLARAYHGK